MSIFLISMVFSLWLSRDIGTWDTMVLMLIGVPLNLILLIIIIVAYK
jgi:hypothetical protein